MGGATKDVEVSEDGRVHADNAATKLASAADAVEVPPATNPVMR